MYKLPIFVLLITMVIISGCSDSSAKGSSASKANSEPSSSVQTPPEASQEPSAANDLSVTKDDVTISIIEAKVSPIIGDRTKDNVGQDNGEYFAMGSDIVKASDYEQIEVNVSIDNNSSKAINFSQAGWLAKLPDGYKLKVIDAKGKIKEQMASNQTGEGKLIFIKEKTITAKNVLLTYKLMDYGDEFKDALQKAMRGELTKKEFEKQFKPQEMNFEITL